MTTRNKNSNIQIKKMVLELSPGSCFLWNRALWMLSCNNYGSRYAMRLSDGMLYNINSEEQFLVTPVRTCIEVVP